MPPVYRPPPEHTTKRPERLHSLGAFRQGGKGSADLFQSALARCALGDGAMKRMRIQRRTPIVKIPVPGLVG